MARAGFCRQCGNNVWLADDGSCTHGHPADQISGSFDVPSRTTQSTAPARDLPRYVPPPTGPTPPAAPPLYRPTPATYEQIAPRKRPKGLVLAVSIAVICGALLYFGGGLASVIMLTGDATARTSDATCYTNQTLIIVSAMDYRGRRGRLPATVQDMVNDGDLESMPRCLAGGTYVWDPATGSVRCTKHPAIHVAPVPAARPRKVVLPITIP